jgi:hypothetical protein
VEVLCAIVLTVVGIVSAFYLVAISTVGNSDARNMAQAYQAAQLEIELVRNIPFATLQTIIKAPTPAGTQEARFLKADGTSDASRPGDAGYPGQIPNLANLSGGSGGVIITNDSNGTSTTLGPNGTTATYPAKHVTVIVRWTDPNKQPRYAVMGTIIAQGGIGAR